MNSKKRTVKGFKGDETQCHNAISIEFSSSQIDNLKVSPNLDSQTLGYGMSFLHELGDTVFGRVKGEGDNLIYMNKKREDLGEGYGERLSTDAIDIEGKNKSHIPFDEK